MHEQWDWRTVHGLNSYRTSVKHSMRLVLTRRLLTYLLTPWSRVLLKKLTGLQLVKKLPALHGIHKCPSPVRILSHLDPVHIPTNHFLKIYLNIFPPSTPRFPKCSLSVRFPHQNPVHASPLLYTGYIPAHLILDFLTRTIWGEQYRSLSYS